jgi:TolB-like protein/class 3 adenylate cyclase/Tfp pilus assembly protein PilF
MAPRSDRKLAAILASDVVGYSRLMAADEAGTFARLKALRETFIEPQIAAHHGRIVKLMGDGALVEFASVVDAVECAAAIQSGVAEREAALPADQRIAFRIGVNLGDVIIEGGDIHGDGVNVAARLEALAEPGGILISRTVRDNVQDKLPYGFEDLGEQQVKNIPRPVHVFRVVPDGAKPAVRSRTRRIEMRWLWAAAAVVLVLAAAGAWLWPRYDSGARPAVQREVVHEAPLDRYRVAVLPLVNMSADPENEYFADGITEELITQLSKIGQLSVIARTSIMKYKGASKSIAEIGRELKVGSILEGSVRKAGDQVRIAAQLIDVASEAHLWAEDYDRTLESIFAIQSEIAENVARNLKVTLLASERDRMDAGTADPEAHDLYLQALYQRSQSEFPEAIESLEEAVRRDPRYAAAYAALADFTTNLVWYTDRPPMELYKQARRYADTALVLDSKSARAHLALAMVKMYADWDWPGSEAEFQRAIEIDPSFARAHQLYGHYMLAAVRRKDDEALAEVARALELDPLNPGLFQALGWVRYNRQEFDEAIEQFRKNVRLVPKEPWSHVGIGQCYVFKAQYDKGIAEIKEAIELAPDYDYILGYLGWAYGMANKKEEVLDVIRTLDAKAEKKNIDPFAYVWAYGGLGDMDQAFAWLEKAYEAHHGDMIFLRTPDLRRILSSDPRYSTLLRKMRLET